MLLMDNEEKASHIQKLLLLITVNATTKRVSVRNVLMSGGMSSYLSIEQKSDLRDLFKGQVKINWKCWTHDVVCSKNFKNVHHTYVCITTVRMLRQYLTSTFSKYFGSKESSSLRRTDYQATTSKWCVNTHYIQLYRSRSCYTHLMSAERHKAGFQLVQWINSPELTRIHT